MVSDQYHQQLTANYYPNEEHSWKDKEIDAWNCKDVNNFIMDHFRIGRDEWRQGVVVGFTFRQLDEESCRKFISEKWGRHIFEAKEEYLRRKNEDDLSDNFSIQYSPAELSDDSYDANTSEEEKKYLSDDSCDLDIEKMERPSVKKVGRPKSRQSSSKKRRTFLRIPEFLHCLLTNSSYLDIIKWEDYEERTFRFVESSKVAELWGRRNKNETMNFEKFSRAMRYYYKTKILLPVPQKRLVYKFGGTAFHCGIVF